MNELKWRNSVGGVHWDWDPASKVMAGFYFHTGWRYDTFGGNDPMLL